MDGTNIAAKGGFFSSRRMRKIFWMAWPWLTLVGLLLVGARTWTVLGGEGQLIDKIRPNPDIALISGMQLGQTFVAPRPGLERIDVLMYGYHRRNTQPITFHLRKVGAEEDEASFTFNASQVWGWRWQSFRFAPLADSDGQAYYFFLDSPASTPDDALTLGGVEGDVYPNGIAFINGHPAKVDAAFKTFYANVSPADKFSALVARITESKPSIWGDIRFYILLSVLYVLILLRVFVELIRLA